MDDFDAQLDRFLGKRPRLGRQVYIAQSAIVMGDVSMGDQSSIWHNAVARGDINYIRIGKGSNIQDNSVIHLADDYPCVIGDWVTVGHGAIVHACAVGNETLVGMGSTILDGAEVGNQCIIGANALVTQGTKIPDGSLVMGAPAKVKRALSESERAALKSWAEKYVKNAAYCLKNGVLVGQPK